MSSISGSFPPRPARSPAMSRASPPLPPVGVGTVDIRVTNEFGTSPAVPVYPNLSPYNYNDQFTFRLLASSAG